MYYQLMIRSVILIFLGIRNLHLILSLFAYAYIETPKDSDLKDDFNSMNSSSMGIVDEMLDCAEHMSSATYNYQHLSIAQPSEFVYNAEINLPDKMNALSNQELWEEISDFFSPAPWSLS